MSNKRPHIKGSHQRLLVVDSDGDNLLEWLRDTVDPGARDRLLAYITEWNQLATWSKEQTVAEHALHWKRAESSVYRTQALFRELTGAATPKRLRDRLAVGDRTIDWDDFVLQSATVSEKKYPYAPGGMRLREYEPEDSVPPLGEYRSRGRGRD